MKINDENIGKFFQENLKDMEIQPDEAVWSAIKQQSGISSGLSSLTKVALYFMGAAIIVSSYFLWQVVEQKNPTISEDKLTNSQLIIASESTPLQEEIVPQDDEGSNIQAPSNNQRVIDQQANEANSQPNRILEVEGSDQIVKDNSDATKSSPKSEKAEMVKVKPIDEIYQAHYVGFGNEIDSEQLDTSHKDETLVNNSDTIKIQYSDNPTICFGEDAKLNVEGGHAYDWNTGASTSYLNVSPVEQSDYWVIVTDQFGNEKKHIFTVYIDKECTAIFVPSAFTPNSDGINDVFKAQGLGIQSFEMIIFNREGQIVFESSNIENAWDGSNTNGQILARMYFYKIVYTDAKGNKHIKQGQVTLIK